jgi:Fe-S cluster biogenesis protein NfuA
MFIQTEQTPNPSSLKFLPGCEVMLKGTAEFKDAAAAKASPLAERLFNISGVTGVFLAGDFITVTKSDAKDWPQLKPVILGALMEHFATGQKVMANEDNIETAASSASSDDSDVVRQIKELIDTRVRPIVAQDGGDIVFSSFDNGVVYLHMRGACAGCPSSTATLKSGIENMLKHFIPEVEEVRAVN